jgi:putative DNA primase/helicase
MASIHKDPELSQMADAERFVAAAGGRLVVEVSDRERWLAFDGNIWQTDEAETAARELAISTLSKQHASIGDEDLQASYAAQRLTLNYPNTLMRAAQADRRLRKPTSHFDRGSHLLGCANGVLDLRTGTLGTGQPDLWVSRSTQLAFDPAATAPRWERFLTEVLPSDHEVQTYFQDLVGYLLTGETNLQKMWIFHGRGANGKTVLLRTLLDLLGDYGQQAPRSVLLGSEHHGGPRTDITRLAGMRLVALTETDRDDRFSESRVKELTGGERVVARRLYAEEFEFVPQAKFLLATNTLPAVRGSDEGIWRRLVVMPFTQAFPNPDPGLIDKLRQELPGILAWAARGAQRFYANNRRLPTPSVFRAASDAYRSDQDHVSQFLTACCDIKADGSVSAHDLQAAYTAWARDEGRVELDWQSCIAAGLRERGFERLRSGKARRYHWQGLTLNWEVLPQLTLEAILPPNSGRTPANPGRRTPNSRPPLGHR